MGFPYPNALAGRISKCKLAGYLDLSHFYLDPPGQLVPSLVAGATALAAPTGDVRTTTSRKNPGGLPNSRIGGLQYPPKIRGIYFERRN